MTCIRLGCVHIRFEAQTVNKVLGIFEVMLKFWWVESVTRFLTRRLHYLP